jgi:hypothetical protein
MAETEGRAGRLRIFSIKRAALSCVPGFLIPLGYAVVLSEAYEYPQRPTPQFLAWPFGWPRPLWILLLGREPRSEEIVGGLIFFAVCNTLLYGAFVYVALTMRLLVRRGRAAYEPPPAPERFPSADE